MANNLDLHQMKCLFSDQHQDKIEFSYLIKNEHSELQPDKHKSIKKDSSSGYGRGDGYHDPHILSRYTKIQGE